MDVDAAPTSKQQPEPIPEVDIYFRLLILHRLLTSSDSYSKATQLAHETVEKMQTLNRRSMDPIAAKIWYAVERTDTFIKVWFWNREVPGTPSDVLNGASSVITDNWVSIL